jgi:hypothetical protein
MKPRPKGWYIARHREILKRVTTVSPYRPKSVEIAVKQIRMKWMMLAKHPAWVREYAGTRSDLCRLFGLVLKREDGKWKKSVNRCQGCPLNRSENGSGCLEGDDGILAVVSGKCHARVWRARMERELKEAGY